MARETSTAARRRLAQLSSGTRMQLLLALRLAFALEAEQRCEALPFFLDEALTVADPDRFGSVVECLHAFAREENRQVFYLTAQPADVVEWTGLGIEANCIRLDVIRTLANALPDRESLELPEPEPVPSSEGLTAAEYGARLKVPGVDLWDPPESVHLFHVLRDDLPFLERILGRGIRTAGQLKSLLDSEAAASVLTGGERAELEWRLAGVDVALTVCREGRGRPVDRAALEATGMSDRFVDRLSSLAQELSGDARALLEAIDDRSDDRVKGFRAAWRAPLTDYLEEHEHVDDRSPLERAEIEIRVLAAMTSFMEDEATSPEQVTSFVRGLVATVVPG